MWSGPEAETMCSVPPDTGFDELDVDDEDVDDELHAASRRGEPGETLGRTDHGHVLLGQEANASKDANRWPCAVDHYLPGETVRSRR
jgi:hypothetical protein